MFLNVIYSCGVKAECSASLLQSLVSHDPSEIILKWWLVLKKHLLFLSMLKTIVLLNVYVETVIHFILEVLS